MGKAKRKHVEQLTGDGPTEHAKKREDYQTRRVERNGPRIAYNRDVTPIVRAFENSKLTPRQRDAAERFEQAYIATYRVPGTRDPLDMSPRGTVDETPQEWALRMKRTCHGIMADLSKDQGHVLIAVAVFHEAIGDCRMKYRRFALLNEALDIAADFLGLPLSGG